MGVLYAGPPVAPDLTIGLFRRRTLTRDQARARLRRIDLTANRTLRFVSLFAALLVAATIVEIGYEIFSSSGSAVSHLGLGFLTHSVWSPTLGRAGEFGAGGMILGTLVTSAMALVLAAPVGIAIGLYLSLLAPHRVAVLLGPLVEMLAAVPSVIIGFWGLIVLAPFAQSTLEPFLHSTLGFLPIFGVPQTTGLSLFTAGLVLTIMIVPIIAALTRDLFATVPRELKDGAEALGATRWEMVRGVVLPTTVPGIAAASMLALGRALGEAIAVASVVGGSYSFHSSLFQPGSTLASSLALGFGDQSSKLQTSALFYLAAVLLVIGVLANLAAQYIARRYSVRSAL